jgi:hypothetical protein
MTIQSGSKPLLYPVLLALAVALGCVEKRDRPQLLFRIGSLNQTEWVKVDKTCEYEAAKAVAPIKIGIIATEQYRKLYIFCAESKGAIFMGSTETMTSPDRGVIAVHPYFWN